MSSIVFLVFIVAVTLLLSLPSSFTVDGVTAFSMVSLYGQHTRTFVGRRSSTATAAMAAEAVRGRITSVGGGSSTRLTGDIPPDPRTLLTKQQLNDQVERLADWFDIHSSSGSGRGRFRSYSGNGRGGGGILCLTGAGLSTESGIPDYRGSRGSYHRGHKPMIHQQYMESAYQRQRYWGRSMVGWSQFDSAQPNPGHVALAALEHDGLLGLSMEDRAEFYDEMDRDEFLSSSGQRSLTIVTQNVDSLHQRAGSKARNLVHLHGAGRVLKCMNCGSRMDRNLFHQELEAMNRDWLDDVLKSAVDDDDDDDDDGDDNGQRPDGDAQLKPDADYNHVHVPHCHHCGVGFWKPDVVFFGDSVPKHRVALCQQAVQDCNAILVVGTSLAVHSAYRHVRAASQLGKSVAIVNVGETRAEAEGLDGILKIEAPIGDTLDQLVSTLGAANMDETDDSLNGSSLAIR